MLGVNGAELSIRAGIAEIEGELSGLHLNRHGVGGGWSEVDVGPGLDAENAQRQNFRSDQQNRGPYQALAPPGKFLIFSPGLGLENFQMKKPG